MQSLAKLISSCSAFFDEPKYIEIRSAITSKRPYFGIAFALVSAAMRTRLGNFALIFAALAGYRAFRLPTAGTLFQYGSSDNNQRAFRRINALCGRPDWNDRIDGRAVGASHRLSILRRVSRLWTAAGVLKQHRASDPFPHLQLAIAVAAWLIYEAEDWEGVRLVCVASDHSPICMALLHVARERGIRTCYLQHAPVSDYFPPLDYDLSVLFDRESEALYEHSASRRGVASRGQVAILPPFETECVPVSLPSGKLKVGICLSYLPDLAALDDLIDALRRHPAVAEVRLRRHPRCRLDITSLTTSSEVSEPERGSVSDFLASCDLILAPNSGVAIEALHLGKPCLYTPGMDYMAYDYYGFVQSGVTPVFQTSMLDRPGELMAFFGPAWRDRFSAYDQTLMTPLAVSRREAAEAFLGLLTNESRASGQPD